MSEELVLNFNEGHRGMKDLLGGKGANLAEMKELGLPVPPGFTITTSACKHFFEEDEELSPELVEGIEAYLKELEDEAGKKFGDRENPLLVSVRSGAAVSMPGMMDTILNLGLNDISVEGIARETDDRRFAFDCYRRFIQMFGEVVLKVEAHRFSRILEEIKEEQGVENDAKLKAESLERLVQRYKDVIEQETGTSFPQDPMEQLLMAVSAVFSSWDNRRARVYRKANNIPHHLGTAVNVQAMVFGNTGDNSGTGVLFTRNPSNGEKKLYGEFLINAQGEDVVAGIRTPLSIQELKDYFPDLYQELQDQARTLEESYSDMQDIEFTIEKNRLFFLQTRTGKRTAEASIRIAVEMVEEGIIDIEEALLRVDPEQLERILHPQIDKSSEVEVMATGLPASPGAATGYVTFSPDEAEELAEEGQEVILVSPETTPDDIHGVIAARGVLTTRGGMTSHAAVVARGMGKPCVCGCEEIDLDLENASFEVNGYHIKAGDSLTINGSTGEVIFGEVKMSEARLSPQARQLLDWVDETRVLGVRANADNAPDARRAREFGAEGIGLCRTEHMFMARERLPLVQRLILSEDSDEQQQVLEKLRKLQQDDFKDILSEMQGLPVTIRLLDPPLHEFLPDLLELSQELQQLEKSDQREELMKKEALFRRVKNMTESNPMLGMRGCRLGLIRPEIYEMQFEAILRSSLELKEEGIEVQPEIMIPLVSHVRELEVLRQRFDIISRRLLDDKNQSLDYSVGTMIELPRACLTADQIALQADFFSYGTNDLTQTTFGFSRDDAEAKFLHHYLDQKVLTDNPFAVLDREGVGKLVEIGTRAGRSSNPELKVGICGEHGGEPSSIEFCHQTGLDYVSCSPFRVPVARLAAAQAALQNK